MLVIKGNYRLSIDVVCYFLLEAIAICLEAIVIGFLNVFFMRIYIYICGFLFGWRPSRSVCPRFPPGTKVKVELDAEPVDKYGRQLVYLYRLE